MYFQPLVMKEIRDLFLGKALWATILIMLFLSGYSFIQALTLYSEASLPALKFPEIARGLSPLDGIFVPTFGALYLAATFFLPFIAIRTVSSEKQSGGLKLLLQLPYSMPIFFAAKLTAIIVAWILILLPCLFALGFWWWMGGHINTFEIINLILGHFLYAMVIVSIALAAASITESPLSATIATVGITIGFWVLDFASLGSDGFFKSLAGFSLTVFLRAFERGIFSLGTVIGSLLAVLGLLGVAGIWIHPGRSNRFRLRRMLLFIIFTSLAITSIMQINLYQDVTEDRRNSFSRADEAILQSMTEQLFVTVYLAPQDPRLYDLRHSILNKLRRTMPSTKIILKDIGIDKLLIGNDDDYGKIIYRYNKKMAASRSTSEEEVLPKIFAMAGLKRSLLKETTHYPGYPLVVNTHWAKLWFYILLPLVLLIFWVCFHHGLKIKKKILQ